MLAKFLIALAVLVALVFGLEYSMHRDSTGVDIRAANWAQNAAVLAQSTATFAGIHPTDVRAVAINELVLPNGYVPNPGLTPYVAAGNAYLYVAPGQTETPQDVARNLGAPGRRIGIKQGAVAKDARGVIVAGQVISLPAGIPEGSAVYVVLEKLPAPTAPPASPTAAQPPALNPLSNPSNNPPPVVFTPDTSNPLPWSPPVTPAPPVPPPAPAQPPIDPAPAGITGFTIGIHGGYQQGDGPKPGMKTCNGPTFNTFIIWDANQGNPADFYVITMTRNGRTVTKTLQHSQVQCAVSCAGNGSLLTSAEAIAFTPEIVWTRLVYDHIVQVGSGITIYDWFMNMDVTVQSCNSAACSTTTRSGNILGIFSNGQHDCQGGGGYPATAHP